MEVVVLEGSSKCGSALMLTLRRLDSCCSRFCLRSWTPSSSRRRRSSVESSPVFLYLSLWWLLDICKKTNNIIQFCVSALHWGFGPNRAFGAESRMRLLRQMQSGRNYYVNQSMQENASVPIEECDRIERGAPIRPRSSPADAANHAAKRSTSVAD
jgi:hypothetical protein